MNSLWHLIFPSLLIWLSAGMYTARRTTRASTTAPHTDVWSMMDSQPLIQRMLTAIESPQSSPSCPEWQACHPSTRPQLRLFQRSSLSSSLRCFRFFFPACRVLSCLKFLECRNLYSTACITQTDAQSLNQFVLQAESSTRHWKKLKRKARINCRPITEMAKPWLTGTNTQVLWRWRKLTIFWETWRKQLRKGEMRKQNKRYN